MILASIFSALFITLVVSWILYKNKYPTAAMLCIGMGFMFVWYMVLLYS